ncbi:unnamed protein product [Pleuronectes platessa]|uniref:Uncharacterized protein n=1 Tax=Pleuronectes platessa TaxID=8262 RepID=A0A9N7VVS6_PLEPL|nr:unnamed protein product [Pleuronectes platessa]
MRNSLRTDGAVGGDVVKEADAPRGLSPSVTEKDTLRPGRHQQLAPQRALAANRLTQPGLTQSFLWINTMTSESQWFSSTLQLSQL